MFLKLSGCGIFSKPRKAEKSPSKSNPLLGCVERGLCNVDNGLEGTVNGLRVTAAARCRPHSLNTGGQIEAIAFLRLSSFDGVWSASRTTAARAILRVEIV